MPSMRAKVRLREGPSGEVPIVQSQREANISNWEIAPSVSSLPAHQLERLVNRSVILRCLAGIAAGACGGKHFVKMGEILRGGFSPERCPQSHDPPLI